MDSSKLQFLDQWNSIMYVLMFVALGVAFLTWIVLLVKTASIRDHKDKYDFISKHEETFLRVVHFSFATAFMFLANTYKSDAVALSIVWFFIRFFISVAIGTLYGYVAYLILKYYYPTRQSKKLNKLRYTPRINPKTGNKMKLLSEDEEDAYLDEGMQAEENVFSVDYDVWIDEATNDTIIQKYDGRLKALECDRCGFNTLKLEKEEIVEEATKSHNGEIIQHFKCTYCGRIRRKTMVLSQEKSASEFQLDDRSVLLADPLGSRKRVTHVKLEISDNLGDSQSFEFQNLTEAKKFLDEFEFSKLKEED